MFGNQNIFKYRLAFKKTNILESSGNSQFCDLVRCRCDHRSILSVVFTLIELFHFAMRMIFNNFFTIKINSSVSRCINSCNYIKCSSFSCTVRSDQRNNFSFVDLNIHIINSHNTTELHGSIFNFQYIFTHWSLLLLLLSFFWTFQ